MFGARQTAANTYSTVGLETGVVAASPHRLVVMLFDAAIVALRNAAEQMQAGDTAAKGTSISKALSSVNAGLRASLDKTAGGEIADNLDALYAYMERRLLEANLKNQPAILEEVRTLLEGLRTAWNAIGSTPAAPEAAPPQPVQDALAPRRASFVSA